MNCKVGDTLGGYQLIAECGRGAYGSVFLAQNLLTGERYALKTVATAGRNFERELKGLTQYKSACRRTDLLQIYHVEQQEGFFFYTMDAADNYNGEGDYIPDTLAVRLKNSGRLAPEAVKKMAQELFEDLRCLHSKGLCHRDVKPDNILWINGKATLGDVGLVSDCSQTRLAGTPGFIPAEVTAGVREFEAKDDFYALGKSIYCAVTGLPVTQYPSFPDSGTLTGTGELIQLYNKLCGFESEGLFQKAPSAPFGRELWWFVALGIGVICVGAFIFFTGRKALIPPVPQVSPPPPVQPAVQPQAPQKVVPRRPAVNSAPETQEEWERKWNRRMREARENAHSTVHLVQGGRNFEERRAIAEEQLRRRIEMLQRRKDSEAKRYGYY